MKDKTCFNRSIDSSFPNGGFDRDLYCTRSLPMNQPFFPFAWFYWNGFTSPVCRSLPPDPPIRIINCGLYAYGLYLSLYWSNHKISFVASLPKMPAERKSTTYRLWEIWCKCLYTEKKLYPISNYRAADWSGKHCFVTMTYARLFPEALSWRFVLKGSCLCPR